MVQDVEMILREGDAGHIARVICASRQMYQSAQQIAAAAPHLTAEFRFNIFVPFFVFRNRADFVSMGCTLIQI